MESKELTNELASLHMHQVTKPSPWLKTDSRTFQDLDFDVSL